MRVAEGAADGLCSVSHYCRALHRVSSPTANEAAANYRPGYFLLRAVLMPLGAIQPERKSGVSCRHAAFRSEKLS